MAMILLLQTLLQDIGLRGVVGAEIPIIYYEERQIQPGYIQFKSNYTSGMFDYLNE